MKSTTLHLPKEINEANEREIRMVVAAILFDKSLMSSGEAARFAGISKRDFLVMMGNYARVHSQVLAKHTRTQKKPEDEGTAHP